MTDEIDETVVKEEEVSRLEEDEDVLRLEDEEEPIDSLQRLG